ncbi:MAG: hypothetical protein ACREA0_13095, partial [bacterium]
DYVCLELGNYLTDVSQFRDPYAQMLGKRMVWSQALGDIPVLPYIPVFGLIISEVILNFAVDLDEWIDRMFGVHEPANKRFGKLSQYFQQVVSGLTHVIFANDITNLTVWEKALRLRMGVDEALPPEELNRIYDKFFTQYWPHEHTDFPPYVLYGEHRPQHRLYRRSSRGTLNYLEEYLDFQAQELSRIEEEWKKRKHLSRDHPARHDVLVRLGKVLHGVEDYFFHSNYLELHLWNEFRRQRPAEETDVEYRRWFAANISQHWLPTKRDLDPSIDRRFLPSQTHQIRSHLRRLRYPRFQPVNTLDRETSQDALDTLFTAGFEKKDLFHTMAYSLEGLESAFDRLDQKWALIPDFLKKKWTDQDPGHITETELVLIKTFISKEERSRMGRDEKYLAGRLAVHKKQLQAGLYEDTINRLRTDGYLNDTARNAWLQAVAIDKEMEGFGEKTPGVGGFLMAFLAQAQRELDQSRIVSRRFDTSREFGEGNVFDIRSDNGASGEAIGTHTLMAKDTPKSVPVYEECRVVAKFASTAIASILTKEVNENSSIASGLD